MSRIGKSPITIPSGIEIKVDGNSVTVKGPKGELAEVLHPSITMTQEDGILTFSRESDSPDHRAQHGLSRALSLFEPDLRKPLKTAGMLTRDSRVVERKKYGRAKARKSFQFSKR